MLRIASLPLALDSWLAVAAGLLAALLLALAVLGESTLPLFPSREHAARWYATAFAGLGLLSLALSMPALLRFFVGRLRAVVHSGGADSALARLMMSDHAPDTARAAGWMLLALFAAAAVVVSVLVWRRPF